MNHFFRRGAAAAVPLRRQRPPLPLPSSAAALWFHSSVSSSAAVESSSAAEFSGAQKSGGAAVAGKPAAPVPVSYILASNELEVGDMVMNRDSSKPSKSGLKPLAESKFGYQSFDLNSKVGSSMPLSEIRIGTMVHNIELTPGRGAQMVRAAGTCAKIVNVIEGRCLVRLPSGAEKLVDSRCRATVGAASNPSHGARKLRKAGQSRWLGRRPTVRGVAMNPVDHPHGGGEGRTKGGRLSVSPWGKPTKAGYRAPAVAARKRRV